MHRLASALAATTAAEWLVLLLLGLIMVLASVLFVTPGLGARWLP